MMVAICLILLPFVVARGVRLVVEDAITLPVRQRILQRFGEDGWLTYLVHCTWCSALYVSVLAVAPTMFALKLPLWVWPLVILACAQVSPMILSVANRIESGGN